MKIKDSLNYEKCFNLPIILNHITSNQTPAKQFSNFLSFGYYKYFPITINFTLMVGGW